MGSVSLGWRRAQHVFICLSDGAGPLDDTLFEHYYADLSHLGFTHFLSVVSGSPYLTPRQGKRILEIPEAFDVTMAVVFDGSPVVHGIAFAFASFMPRTQVFRADEMLAALDFLGLEGEARNDVVDTVGALRREMLPGLGRSRR